MATDIGARKWVTLEKPAKKPYHERPTFLYFIQCQTTQKIKIGYARDPLNRISTMQTGCPTELRVLVTVPGTRFDERALHVRFRAHYYRGEWFDPAPEILEFIEATRARPSPQEIDDGR